MLIYNLIGRTWLYSESESEMLITLGDCSLYMPNGKKKSLLSVLFSLLPHVIGTNIDSLVAAFYYRSLPSAFRGYFKVMSHVNLQIYSFLVCKQGRTV